eukprot:2033512-Pleurochrysis_carterae.AAC.1
MHLFFTKYTTIAVKRMCRNDEIRRLTLRHILLGCRQALKVDSGVLGSKKSNTCRRTVGKPCRVLLAKCGARSRVQYERGIRILCREISLYSQYQNLRDGHKGCVLED